MKNVETGLSSMRGLLYNIRNNATPAPDVTTTSNIAQPHYSYQAVNYPSKSTRLHYYSVMYSRDWRTALKTPPTYRIGNRTLRFNYHMALILSGVFIFIILLYYMRSTATSTDAAWLKNYASSTSGHRKGAVSGSISSSSIMGIDIYSSYNNTYPLTAPLVSRPGLVTYRIGMVADLDVNAKIATGEKMPPVWRSYLMRGYLTYISSKDEVTLKWDTSDPQVLESSFSLKDRGLELSELVTFNGKLLTFDDRTGLVYELNKDKVVPWIILMDGNGHSTKGFKSEWATIKDSLLYVGSMGKEWTTGSGDYENDNPMFVKVITTTGAVRSLDWSTNYKRLRQMAADISWPGYMIHESAVWSAVHKKWFFLPRRCSKDKYNETRDEHMGCNILITADENFIAIESVQLDAINTHHTHGVSSFKFIPNTDDRIIVAIRSEEVNGKTTTFITAFDISGKTLLPEQHIDTDYKFEGFEFI